MSTNETALAASPATEAATPELNTGLLSDAQLASIFGSSEPTSVEPATASATPVTPQATAAATGNEAAGELDLTALDELDKAEPAPPVTIPASTPDSDYMKLAQQVLPTKESLGWAVDAFQRTTKAAQAAQSGNLQAALDELPFMKPAMEKAVLDYVKANEDKIIEQYIRKHSPESRNPEVEELRQQLGGIQKLIADSQQQLLAQRQAEAQAGQVQAQQKAVAAVDTEVTALLNKVRFTTNEAERELVSDLVKVAISKKPDVFQEVMAGKMGALRPVFSEVVKKYVDLDKTKRGALSDKKPAAPILTGAGSAVGGDTPDVWQKSANWLTSLQQK